MATTKTTKLADAISLLSDVLSTEIAEGNHFLEDEDDSVSADDHEELKDEAADFITTALSELEDIQSQLQSAVEAVTDDDADDCSYEWDADDEEEDVGIGEVVVDGDSEGDADPEDEAEPTDAEKIELLLAAGEELEDKIVELESDKEALTEALQCALSAIDSLVDDVVAHQTELEAY